MTLAAALSAELVRRSLTPADLARLSGLSRGRVGEILDGTTANPGMLTVAKLLAALGQTLAWLEREMKKPSPGSSTPNKRGPQTS